jgi:hypothetical protein
MMESWDALAKMVGEHNQWGNWEIVAGLDAILQGCAEIERLRGELAEKAAQVDEATRAIANFLESVGALEAALSVAERDRDELRFRARAAVDRYDCILEEGGETAPPLWAIEDEIDGLRDH